MAGVKGVLSASSAFHCAYRFRYTERGGMSLSPSRAERLATQNDSPAIPCKHLFDDEIK
jgi:hypothetical protein